MTTPTDTLIAGLCRVHAHLLLLQDLTNASRVSELCEVIVDALAQRDAEIALRDAEIARLRGVADDAAQAAVDLQREA